MDKDQVIWETVEKFNREIDQWCVIYKCNLGSGIVFEIGYDTQSKPSYYSYLQESLFEVIRTKLDLDFHSALWLFIEVLSGPHKKKHDVDLLIADVVLFIEVDGMMEMFELAERIKCSIELLLNR